MTTKETTEAFLKNIRVVIQGKTALFALQQVFFPNKKIVLYNNQCFLAVSETTWINEQLQTEEKPKNTSNAPSFSHFYEACAQGIVDINQSQQLVSMSHKLRQMGLGLKWEGAPTSYQDFVSVLVEFGCHEKVAEAIASDLNKNGTRFTTVRYELKNKLPVLYNSKALGVVVSQALPSVMLSQAPLPLKLKQLARQFKN